MIKFKILDTSTGLYSHGGYRPTWSTRGKGWDSKKSIISHLRMYGRKRSVPESWMVVEFKVSLTEINRTPIIDLIGKEEMKPCKTQQKKKPQKPKPKERRQRSRSQGKTGKRSRD